MREIGIGIVGGGYMGKAHSVAMAAVGAVFNTALRPRLEMICATSDASAERYRAAFGFARATADWRALVADPRVEAVVIASPQETHRAIAEAAFSANKPVFCEKPLGANLDDSRAMVAAAQASGCVNMVGFNYIRTPASQYARALVQRGEIGDVIWFRGEHSEDFDADATKPATWRNFGAANGTMGDLAPHMINAALALIGPIARLSADIATIHATRPGSEGGVLNDDIGQFMCRFANGAMGHLSFSRVALGRKMGYAYEITGTNGAIRFDQEDQNALWLYRADDAPGQRGFRKILTGPDHPDYLEFCQGAGHGTGYQDQIIIEARDFLRAIETNQSIWPSFADGMEVNRVIEAAHASAGSGTWINL
ncbi:Gfo/Idh/MocA family protein [Cypionkella sp.]|uniref:Gfo/Idh/MocA family protein n=1 Tax=Cypionkella sp. TaxID=2811411 RepID=UPI0027228DF0|nr:Gfo/Idh/MocA family oxidoreductase [Cypionkella sp.]MDO8985815.1 Gfo/Idh/MocA family oxidoreductase [Cypionkella sp.]MDP2051395.1 Gfo/Idh/MocA family oxidoreductase [Cypionkella sp.]